MTAQPGKLYTLRGVATLKGCDVRTVRAAIADGTLTAWATLDASPGAPVAWAIPAEAANAWTPRKAGRPHGKGGK